MKDYNVREEKRGKVHGLRVQFDADAAPSEAIQLIWDVEVHAFISGCPKLEILQQSEAHQQVRYVIDAKFKNYPMSSIKTLAFLTETRQEVSWSMVKEDLRSVDGAWRISSRTDGQSDIEYESFVDASVFIGAVIRQGALQKLTKWWSGFENFLRQSRSL